MLEYITDVPDWIKAHAHTETGVALAMFAMTDRLEMAQEDACREIEERGWLSEKVADELKLAAYLDRISALHYTTS